MKKILMLLLMAIAGACHDEKVKTQDAQPPPDDLNSGAAGFYRFIPNVIDVYSGTPVLLEVSYPNLPESPTIVTSAGPVQLFDDGTHRDKFANDRIFTAEVLPSSISILENDVYRPVIGRIDLPAGGYINIQAEVWTGDLPLVDTELLQGQFTMQKTDHLVNLVVAQPDMDQSAEHCKAFYSSFPDEYDFINLIYVGLLVNRHHQGVRNEVEGIGMPVFDAADRYGSAGRLMGINIFPNTRFFDGASTGTSHEIGHTWINFLQMPLLTQSLPHWPLSDLAPSVMGMSGQNQQGIQFNFKIIPSGTGVWHLESDNAPKTFNDLDLYLMGLMMPEEVGTYTVFENQNQSIVPGAALAGPVTQISVQDIIGRFGQRKPSAADAQKHFNIATVIVTERPLSVMEMSFYDFFAERMELQLPVKVREGNYTYDSNPFFIATRGRATLSAGI